MVCPQFFRRLSSSILRRSLVGRGHACHSWRLLDEGIEAYAVDPRRVYLTGLSMGGYGSWWLATAYPDRFAALVSVTGSGYRMAMAPEPENMCCLQDLAVWAIHGAQDKVSDPLANRLQVMSLAQCAGEVQWTRYPNADHGETYSRAYRDPELYSWLLSHQRKVNCGAHRDGLQCPHHRLQ